MYKKQHGYRNLQLLHKKITYSIDRCTSSCNVTCMCVETTIIMLYMLFVLFSVRNIQQTELALTLLSRMHPVQIQIQERFVCVCL